MSAPKTAEELTGIDEDLAIRILTMARKNCRDLADRPELWPAACKHTWDTALECDLIDEHQHAHGVLTAKGEAPDIHVTLGWRTG